MKKISWNSPVVLGFVFLSLFVLVLNILTRGYTNQLLFSVYKSSFLNPLFYIRLFGHVLGHGGIEHYFNNMLLLLLVGPLLEEKYGSKRFLTLLLLVALVTGLVHILIGKQTALMGASGVVFACIILSSITGRADAKTIPVTLIIVALLYIGQQVYEGIFVNDNISQLTHIVGGIVGALYGLYLQRSKQ